MPKLGWTYVRNKRLGLLVEMYTGKRRKIKVKLLCEQQSDGPLMARMSEESVPIALLFETIKISVKNTGKKTLNMVLYIILYIYICKSNTQLLECCYIFRLKSKCCDITL